MASSLRGYEGQAFISVVLSLAAGALALVGVFLVFQRFDWANFATGYAPGTMRMPFIVASLGIATALAAIGSYLGINSANQPRNKQSGRSWMGFFLNAGVLMIALSVAAFFWATKMAVLR